MNIQTSGLKLLAIFFSPYRQHFGQIPRKKYKKNNASLSKLALAIQGNANMAKVILQIKFTHSISEWWQECVAEWLSCSIVRQVSRGSLVWFSLTLWLYQSIIERDTEPPIAPDGQITYRTEASTIGVWVYPNGRKALWVPLRSKSTT